MDGAEWSEENRMLASWKHQPDEKHIEFPVVKGTKKKVLVSLGLDILCGRSFVTRFSMPVLSHFFSNLSVHWTDEIVSMIWSSRFQEVTTDCPNHTFVTRVVPHTSCEFLFLLKLLLNKATIDAVSLYSLSQSCICIEDRLWTALTAPLSPRGTQRMNLKIFLKLIWWT